MRDREAERQGCREAKMQRSREEAEKQRGREVTKFEKKPIKTYRDLNVYQQSFHLALEIYQITTTFPEEERYSLVDQMRRASRSIPANLAEGWAKRRHEKIFKRHLVDCLGSCEEMKIWLEFGMKFNYIEEDKYTKLTGKYAEIGAMLSSLAQKWQIF
ncbi:MAG: four helix bundle protein [Deltaproteobacteria bacterium]|nr:four helix bundle protein [Deltaproteobacteria bacterium]